jgi:methyl coenzyme M reductase gamma subunit
MTDARTPVFTPIIIWTLAVRVLLYTMLVKHFGPSTTWEKTHSPGRDLDVKFKQFCEAFALVIGAKSGDAVLQQILFALPAPKDRVWDAPRARTAMMNMTAALDAGFISNAQLPEYLMVHTKGRPLQ